MRSGVQCVMTSGVYLMLEWPAGNWDSLKPVSLVLCIYDFINVHCSTTFITLYLTLQMLQLCKWLVSELELAQSIWTTSSVLALRMLL